MPASGGKKGAQRTKGNVKPSSSSQAAELLAQSGVGRSGFIGFGSTGSPSYVPASETFDDVDSSLDADFRMVLRKLSKRDSTTKIKALQEFSALCQEKDEECLKGVLPFWPRIYNRMSIDLDYRVREASQQAMTTLVSQAHRNIAPYLKSMMGSWLLSQCDTYATVASSATQAFQTAFPPAKQQGAIDFCKMEITEYLVDNLVTQTPSTLSDPKTSSSEEMDNKYNRVITSSFFALKKLLLLLKTSSLDSVRGHMTGLLNDGKFWKHSKSSVSNVKGGQFAFCSSLCQIMPEVATEYVAKLSPLILNAIDITDPVVCSSLWEAVLSLVKYVPESWKHVSWTKSFWPKLRTLLEKGCHGNGVVIAPNILPLLSQIPQDIHLDSRKFVTEFFKCFKQGFAEEQVQLSSSESSALVVSFFECCQYEVKRLAKDDAQKETIQVLLLDHVLPLVESSLLEPKLGLYKTPLYGALSQLTTFLERSDHGAEISALCYKSLVQTVEETYPTLVDSGLFHSFSSHLLALVSGLLHPNASTKAKSEKVKFVDEKIPETEISSPSEIAGSSKEFVTSVLSFTYRKCVISDQTEFIDVFARIFKLYNSEESVSSLLNLSSCESEDNPSVCFLKQIIIPKIETMQGLNDTSNTMVLLDVVFVCLQWTGDENAFGILSLLAKCTASPVLLYDLVNKVLSMREPLPSVSSWLKSSELTERVISLSEDICTHSMEKTSEGERNVESGWSLITLVLSATVADEPVFHPKCIEGILDVIMNTLKHLSSSITGDRGDKAAGFVARAAKTFFQNPKVCSSMDSIENLLVALFNIYMDLEYSVGDKTRLDIQEAIDIGMTVIIRQTGAYFKKDGFLESTVRNVQSLLSSKIQTIARFEHTVQCVHHFLSTLRASLPDSSYTNPTIQFAVDNLFVVPRADNFPQIEEYMTIKDHLFLKKLVRQRSPYTLPQLIFPTLFNVEMLMYKVAGQVASTAEKPDSDEASVHDMSSEDIQRLLDCLVHFVVCKWWADNDKKARRQDDVTASMEQLEGKVGRFVTSLTADTQRKLLNLGIARSEEVGCVVSVMLSSLLAMLRSSNSEVQLSDDAVIDRCSTLTVSRLHTLQSIMRFVSDSACVTSAEILNARLITTPADSSLETDGGVGMLALLNVTLMHLDMRPEVKDMYKSILGHIIEWKQEAEDLLLLACDLSESSLEKISLNVEVMKFLHLYVTKFPELLTNSDWDFVLCSAVAWIQTVVENEDLLASEIPVSVFSMKACQLLADIVSCMDMRVRTSQCDFPENLVTEWDEFFSEGVFSVLLPLYIKLVGNMSKISGSGIHDAVVNVMSLAVSVCPKQHTISHQLSANLIAEELSPLPDSLQTVINTFCPMLLSTYVPVQIGAYFLLSRIVGDLSLHEKDDKEDFDRVKDEDKREDEYRKPPMSLNKVCDEGMVAMEHVLWDGRIEECVEVTPDTDEYKYAMGYLLSWKLILKLFKSSPSELRAQYAVYFKTSGIIHHLLTHLFQLMPDNPVAPTSGTSYFQHTDQLHVLVPSSSQDVKLLSCDVYRQCLETIPALVRQWWMEQDKATTSYVDKFTKKHVSPLLCHSEITSVQNTDDELQEIVIKARPKIREVIATYTMSEVTVEVVISLPENYPLGSISVVSDKKVGVTQSQWDRWLLQLNIFLQHQNGTIIEGLKLWKKNIDKRFEGVDDCMICYSVLHGTNFQLPRLQCRTCKKKFHSACLYKWFSTSHNSTCPLCRNLF